MLTRSSHAPLVGVVIMQRLDFRRARLRQRSLGVEHVKLRAGPGVGARARFTQRFIGFLLHFLLRVQNFAGFDELGICRAYQSAFHCGRRKE